MMSRIHFLQRRDALKRGRSEMRPKKGSEQVGHGLQAHSAHPFKGTIAPLLTGLLRELSVTSHSESFPAADSSWAEWCSADLVQGDCPLRNKTKGTT